MAVTATCHTVAHNRSAVTAKQPAQTLQIHTGLYNLHRITTNPLTGSQEWLALLINPTAGSLAAAAARVWPWMFAQNSCTGRGRGMSALGTSIEPYAQQVHVYTTSNVWQHQAVGSMYSPWLLGLRLQLAGGHVLYWRQRGPAALQPPTQPHCVQMLSTCVG